MCDYDETEVTCPQCGEAWTRTQQCQNGCDEDGRFDEYDSDPINFSPGERYYNCDFCFGHGTLHWCGECGFDFNDPDNKELADKAYADAQRIEDLCYQYLNKSK